MAVEINPSGRVAAVAEDKYPTVPKPITVDVSALSKNEVLTKSARFAVETNPTKLAVEIKPSGRIAAVADDKYPTVPKPIIVDVN